MVTVIAVGWVCSDDHMEKSYEWDLLGVAIST